MKLFLIISLFLGTALADYNLELLERAVKVRQNAAPALAYLNANALKEAEKTLQANLKEMNDLVDHMKTESFRTKPIFSMETKLLATERAVVYEIRQSLLNQSRDLLKRADAAIDAPVADQSKISQIKVQKIILTDLFQKLATDEDLEKADGRLERLMVEHQEKLMVLLGSL